VFVQRTTGSVESWFVVFERDAPYVLVPSYFKHVLAYGYCEAARSWVLIDPHFAVMDVRVVPAHEGEAMIAWFTRRAIAVLKIDAGRRARPNVRLLGCCTSTVRDLIGLPGFGLLSSLPDALYNDCIMAGAVVCVDNRAPSRKTAKISAAREMVRMDGRRWWRRWRPAGSG
jgi:hypothetical protein